MCCSQIPDGAIMGILLDFTFSNSHPYCCDSTCPLEAESMSVLATLTQDFSENKVWGALGNSSTLNIQSTWRRFMPRGPPLITSKWKRINASHTFTLQVDGSQMISLNSSECPVRAISRHQWWPIKQWIVLVFCPYIPLPCLLLGFPGVTFQSNTCMLLWLLEKSVLTCLVNSLLWLKYKLKTKQQNGQSLIPTWLCMPLI